MSGTKMGSIKAKLGLKGQTKPGQMIQALNKIKSDTIKKQIIGGAA